MADEAEQGGGGGSAGGGSVLKKYGPLAAIVLLAQVVLAWVVITVTVGDKMGSKEQDETLISGARVTESAEAQETQDLPFYFAHAQLTGITANPAGTNAQRYAVLSVELGLVGEKDGESIPADELAVDPDLVAQVPKYMGLAKSIILAKLRSSYIDDLENNLGTIMDDLKDELNQKVMDKVKWDAKGKKKVRITDIRVTGLVIQ
ncbi:MAG: flagellar basal body-associated FliL family protein [Gemmatimonadota bacterium]